MFKLTHARIRETSAQKNERKQTGHDRYHPPRHHKSPANRNRPTDHTRKSHKVLVFVFFPVPLSLIQVKQSNIPEATKGIEKISSNPFMVSPLRCRAFKDERW